MTKVELTRVQNKTRANKRKSCANILKNYEQKTTHLNKSYLNSIPPIPRLSTPFGEYTAQKLITDQSTNTDHDGMVHALL